ncbi:uncharacterized protein N7483_002586 [Penicillium malachiteum]|uniref:uncharacterized protein n=1 Tax=Penicillium malachiteum TaxID=1324776 RepID=UPI002547477A|nr:uncharacterized protein N7483_002586 [Penicillium malachiteum]KAJ5737461.1 hypothetical protein N7483_002586 [Penicillium malachiteum]
MTSQSAETDYSFAAFPPPDKYRFTHSHWVPQTMRPSGPSHRENILGEIKQEYEHLSQTNKTLTDTLQQLRQENNQLFQIMQLQDKYLQAAQQRIEELKQEADQSKNIAVWMQNWEGRLTACEQHIPMFPQPFSENIQPTLGSSAGVHAEQQRHVPRLRRSGRSTSWKVEHPQSQQPPKQVQQLSMEKMPQTAPYQHGRRD